MAAVPTAPETDDLRVTGGGGGDGPALLLLHGLGATSEVWNGVVRLLDERWPGPWLAPDLPGHGRSGRLRSYSYGSVAAAVAAHLPPAADVVVLGHSFGGVIGLVLGSGWFGCRVAAVLALGVKVRWTDEDVARSETLAARPAAWFDSRDEAVARHLRIAGLQDLVEPDDPAALAGVTARDGRWQLAFDPAAFGVGRPDVAGMLTACRADVRWARGEHDGLVSDDDLRAVAGDHAVLPGLGHSAHIQEPAAVLALLPGPRRAG